MKVLIACEFSGIVRDAFKARGHDAWSCDIVPTERPGQHIVNDVRNVLDYGWDLMIAHPECRYLCRSGARWWSERQAEQKEAIKFVRLLLAAPVPRIAIENPIGILSSQLRKPDQIIQPWQFGEPESKATCLWLKNLPPLLYTLIETVRAPRVHYEAPGPNRSKNRSRTIIGIASAMAQQWDYSP